jgi:hypothetical protein
MCLSSKGRSEDGEFTLKGLVRTTGENNGHGPSKLISKVSGATKQMQWWKTQAQNTTCIISVNNDRKGKVVKRGEGRGEEREEGEKCPGLTNFDQLCVYFYLD